GAMVLAVQNYSWLFSTKDTVRIATGSLTESGEKFVDSFLREMAKESPRIQVTLIQTPDFDASAEALKNGQADAALVRSDNAMAERYPAYDKLDVSQGALIGSPPMPPQEAAALSVAVRLVSNRTLSNSSAGEITRAILATKARLAASEVDAGQIEAPDTDKPV